jgi:hypothetical protein
MAITPEEIEREKDRLPFGWGRFGKAFDRLAELSEPDETLLSSCVSLNPEYKQGVHVARDAVGIGLALAEFGKAMNIVLGATNQRLIAVTTGGGGGPRKDYSIPYEGLEIVERKSKLFVLGFPAGKVKFRGAAKQMVPGFLETLAAHAQPAPAEPPPPDQT